MSCRKVFKTNLLCTSVAHFKIKERMLIFPQIFTSYLLPITKLIAKFDSIQDK